MVELRKRAVREDPPAKPAAPKKAKKDAAPAPAAGSSLDVASNGKTANPAAGGIAPNVDDSIALESFGGEVETNDGEKTTLAKLVEGSEKGVVLFTYPKASTPGCTTQVCLFRDSYSALTAAGLSIFGLSNDSPKANTTFKTKQNLPYALLCDPQQSLISAIGMQKQGKKTTRGVFVVEKSGKVLAAEAGGPAATLDVVKKVIEEMGGNPEVEGVKKAEETVEGAEKEEGKSAPAGEGDRKAADTAAEVADSAEMLDKSKGSTPLPA